MQKIRFELHENFLLEEVFSSGILGYALNMHTSGYVREILLFFLDGSAITCSAYMTDIEGEKWEEIGSLYFTFNKKYIGNSDVVILPESWHYISCVRRLMYKEVNFLSECGVVIKNSYGDEIVILPDVNPEHLSILAPEFNGKFDPEFDLNQYKSETIWERVAV